MALSPAMDTALQGQFVRAFFALKITLPDYTIRLIDGSGFATFNGETYRGSDDTYGVIAGIEAISESIATDAPDLAISLSPPSTSAFVALNNPALQGSPVMVFFGVLNDQTGTVIGSPELLFSGELDFCQSTSDQGSRLIEMFVKSVFDRLMVPNEGERLNDEWHQSIWPGETGLALAVESLTAPIWGGQ